MCNITVLSLSPSIMITLYQPDRHTSRKWRLGCDVTRTRVSTTCHSSWKYEQTQPFRDGHVSISRNLPFAIYISITRDLGREDIVKIAVSGLSALKLKSRTLFRHVAVSAVIRPPLLLVHLTLLWLSVIICRYRTIKSGGAIVRDRRAIFTRDLLRVTVFCECDNTIFKGNYRVKKWKWRFDSNHSRFVCFSWIFPFIFKVAKMICTFTKIFPFIS